MSESKQVIFYHIVGLTKSNVYVSAGWGSQENAIKQFIKKYPRFQGIAHLYEKEGSLFDGIIVSQGGRGKPIMTIESTKQLKVALEVLNESNN